MKDKLHDFDSDTIRVTWSKARCIHAAECVGHLPAVFQPGTRPWIKLDQAEADHVARVVQRCPTGALHFERADSGEAEPVPVANSVMVSRSGPLYLRGDLELCAEDGTVLLTDTRMALCRCGQSANKPLCDNAHRATAFHDDGTVTDLDGVQDPGASGPRLRIAAHTNGPFELDGPLALASGDGATVLAGTSVWLCRCGQSQSKLFCDGSHETKGFRAD